VPVVQIFFSDPYSINAHKTKQNKSSSFTEITFAKKLQKHAVTSRPLLPFPIELCTKRNADYECLQNELSSSCKDAIGERSEQKMATNRSEICDFLFWG